MGVGSGLLWAVLLGCGCGGQGGLGTLDLDLRFAAAALPAETERLVVYVLPSLINTAEGEEEISCDMFVGPTADREIVEFTSYVINQPIQKTIDDPDEDTSVRIEDLPEGRLVFVVQAYDQSSALLALGCGKGQIERGKKTFITVYMDPR
jgi:hypothetical protein